MPDLPPIAIVGAGPQAKVVIDILRSRAGASIAGLLDDAPAKRGTAVMGLQVLGSVEWGLDALAPDVALFVAIGGNGPRVRVANRLRKRGRRLVNAIHASAVLCGGVRLGTNVLVCANAVLGVETAVGDDAVLNTAATVDHESVVDAGAYVAPGVHTAGRVKIGVEAFVGAGTIIGPGVHIGARAIVGAGSLVLGDVPDRMVAWGRPAQVIRAVEEPVNWTAVLGGPAGA